MYIRIQSIWYYNNSTRIQQKHYKIVHRNLPALVMIMRAARVVRKYHIEVAISYHQNDLPLVTTRYFFQKNITKGKNPFE